MKVDDTLGPISLVPALLVEGLVCNLRWCIYISVASDGD